MEFFIKDSESHSAKYLNPIITKFAEKISTSDKKLGSGTFGSCFICTLQGSCTKYALKTIKKNSKKNQRDLVLREVEILTKIRSDDVCSNFALCFRGFDEDAENYYILTDYNEEYQELYDFVFDRKRILEDDNEEHSRRTNIIKNVYDAIFKLHAIGIAHLDIKPTNMLVNIRDMSIMIIDFGTSCVSDNTNTVSCSKRNTVEGTKQYLDLRLVHKILKDKTEITFEESKDADLWAFGVMCILFFMGIEFLFCYEEYNENTNDITTNFGYYFNITYYNYLLIYCTYTYSDSLKKMKELSLYQNEFKHITLDYWKKYKELFDYIDTFFLDTFRGVDLFLLSNIRKYFVKDRFTAGGLNITYINKSKKSKSKKSKSKKSKSKKSKPKRSKRKQ